MDVAAGVTQPANSKNELLSKIYLPNAWRDLRILIGLFVLYSQLLTLYHLEIKPWRYIFIKTAPTRKISQKEEIELMHNL